MTRFIFAAVGLACLITPAAAQVRYGPYPNTWDAPYATNVPVPYGVLQPNETAGTSPAIQIFPEASGPYPAVRVVRHCQYPDGWNVTDFDRDVNGIPAGIDHTCPVYAPARIRARY